MYPCPPGPAERLCLNGGACFTLFENSTDFFCKCAEGYCGVNCGDKYTRNGCYSSFPSSSLVLMASSSIRRPPETFPCPPGPAEWLCLNGGTCFTVFENATDFSCHCKEGYCGLTCGEKYTRYGCFSRYLVISASAASAGTLLVILTVLGALGYVCYHRRSASSDAELKNYFERSMKLRINNGSCLTATGNRQDDLDGSQSETGTDVGRISHLDKYLYKEEDYKDEKIFNDYLNLVRVI
ncbi:hypothetical protein RUM44_003428 [Polyplax serrata]|uniref:EGF-like domain-containing protein n=1 Tax=Polyplax serrata TaxID=468196 RepID=A0ABR1AGG7_POLSC